MKSLIVGCVLAGMCVVARAEGNEVKSKARIELNGGQIVGLKAGSAPEGGSLRNFARGKSKKEDESAYNLICESAPLTDGVWQKIAFSFTPEGDGEVNLCLKGNWVKAGEKKNLDAHWVFVDNVLVEGGTIKNGDFEEAIGTKPAGWKSTAGIVYLSGATNACSGKAMVKVWHNQHCSQMISVKKDVQVTVTLNVMKGDVEMAKE